MNQHVRRLTLVHWRIVNKETQRVDCQGLWNEYIWSGLAHRRVWRILPLFVFYLLAGFMIMFLLGFPFVPYRGDFSLIADKIIIAVVVIAADSALTVLRGRCDHPEPASDGFLTGYE